MADPDGEQHELIDRLLEAVGSTTEEDWFSLVFPLVFAIGGSELSSVVPDHGGEPKPGTMGAALRKTHRACWPRRVLPSHSGAARGHLWFRHA
jgi:hypothetical protein